MEWVVKIPNNWKHILEWDDWNGRIPIPEIHTDGTSLKNMTAEGNKYVYRVDGGKGYVKQIYSHEKFQLVEEILEGQF